MIPKFRAYDSGSLSHMYQPDEVMVCDGKIWIQDEDSEANEWIVNNDLNLMQSTGLKDKNGKEIFEGDIIRYGTNVAEIKRHPTLGFYTVVDGRERFFGDEMSIDDFEEVAEEVSKTFEIIGNIYENPEILEVE